MRRLFLLLLLVFALPAAAGLLDARPSSTLGAPAPSAALVSTSDATKDNERNFLPVRDAFQLSVLESSPTRIKLQFIAADGYYLYRHRFQFHALPASVELGAAQIPDGQKKHDEYFGDVEVYHGFLEVVIPRPPQSAGPFQLSVTYQGCADKGLCYPPETQTLAIGGDGAASLPVAADSPVPARQPSGWSWHELALFVLAGIGLTFTPCVLPMLPILSGVVLRGQVSRLRGLSLSLAYVLPMALCFALLGALMGVFGASLNLQARLQSAWVLVPFAVFFGVFALAMFGSFELRLPAFINDRLDRVAGRTEGGSLWGAAVLGVVSSLLVSPCVSAPLAGALLYISASGDALGGALKLFALGLGMGAPLVLVGTGGAAWLPKSGPWLGAVKNAIGVLLVGVAIALLSRVLPGELTLLLIGLLSASVAVFLGALEFASKAPRQRLAQAFGLLLLAYALACWVGAFSGQTDPLAPLGRSVSINATTVPGQATASAWQTIKTPAELDQVLADAKAAGQPVLLDWYADWCISCKVIEHQVLTDPKVVELLSGYRKVRFDVTDSDPAQRALLDHYQLFGPPVLMFFNKQGSELLDQRIVGEIDVKAFTARVLLANDHI